MDVYENEPELTPSLRERDNVFLRNGHVIDMENLSVPVIAPGGADAGKLSSESPHKAKGIIPGISKAREIPPEQVIPLQKGDFEDF